jgi:hypothetical protein
MQSLWMPGDEAVCLRADDVVVRSGYEEIMRDWECHLGAHDGESAKTASHAQFYTQDVELTFNVRYLFMFFSRFSVVGDFPFLHSRATVQLCGVLLRQSREPDSSI